MQAINSSTISQLKSPLLSGDVGSIDSVTSPQESTFKDMLARSLGEVSQMSLQADQNIYQALTTGDVTNAEVLTSLKKADLALKTMVQFRNKFLEMYQEFQQIRF